MLFEKPPGVPCAPASLINAALRPAVRRPGSMDAFTKPSLVLGKLVPQQRRFTHEEREGLSDSGAAGQHPA